MFFIYKCSTDLEDNGAKLPLSKIRLNVFFMQSEELNQKKKKKVVSPKIDKVRNGM